MRIIAGEMRSRRLKTPEGMETRPTADKVKEALFSILADRVRDARVLDLYGGSGALALEALSRGAAHAVICDCAPKACRAIRENIDALSCGDRARLLRMKDTAALAALGKSGERFDLIFLDPPYRMDTAPICREIVERNLLAPSGLLIVEHSRETPPAAAPPLVRVDHREYGVTGLSMYRRQGEENQ